MAHIFEIPCFFHVLLIGRNNIRCRSISAEGFQNGARFAKSLWAGAVYHDDKTQHTFREDFPHEVKTLLAWRAEQIQHQVLVHSDTAKIHRYGSSLFNGAFMIGRDLPFSRDNINFADRTDQFSLSGTKAASHYHFDRLHKFSPSK